MHGWVDHDKSHSIVCQALLGQMGIGLNWLRRWANLWNNWINFNQTVHQTTSPILYILNTSTFPSGFEVRLGGGGIHTPACGSAFLALNNIR